MSVRSSRHVLLTGPPGIGKTTLIKKVCDVLNKNHVSINGFYTEELRNESNKRIGFDVVSLCGKRVKLARTMESLNPQDTKQYRVGQYFVYPDSFEQIALPLFEQSTSGVLVLDEIGKMELFSNKFQNEVKKAFNRVDVSILATVPVFKGARLPLVESLVANPNYILISVDKNNRNTVLHEIVSYLGS